jgi:hypothetical protein
MDMTFREYEPFYGDKTDLNSLFDFNSPSRSDANQEGESEPLMTKENEPSRVVVGSVPYPTSEERWRKLNEEQNLKAYTRGQPTTEGRWRKLNEEKNLKEATETSTISRTNGEAELQGEQYQQQ